MSKTKLLDGVKKVTNQREFFIIALVAVVYIVAGSFNENFLSKGNQLALLMSVATLLVLGVGVTPLMIAGCFDMSIASILALSGGLASSAAISGWPTWACIALGLTAGALMGAFNGLFVSYGEMPAFVVTLATKNMFRGLLLAVTQGHSLVGFPANYTAIGQSQILGIQLPILFAAFFVIIGAMLLKRLRFFRQCFFIGGNEKAAKLSGIRVKRTKFLLYVFLGIMAGFAGIITTARYGSCMTTTGENMELSVITGTIIGGASMSGGSGSIVGMFFGVLLMTSVTNIMNLFGADIFWQTFIEGIALFGAICLDQVTKMNRNRSVRREAEALLRKQR